MPISHYLPSKPWEFPEWLPGTQAAGRATALGFAVGYLAQQYTGFDFGAWLSELCTDSYSPPAPLSPGSAESQPVSPIAPVPPSFCVYDLQEEDACTPPHATRATARLAGGAGLTPSAPASVRRVTFLQSLEAVEDAATGPPRVQHLDAPESDLEHRSSGNAPGLDHASAQPEHPQHPASSPIQPHEADIPASTSTQQATKTRPAGPATTLPESEAVTPLAAAAGASTAQDGVACWDPATAIPAYNAALQQLVAANASVPDLPRKLRMLKMVAKNLRTQFEQDRYKRLQARNKTLQQMLLALPGHDAVLYALGFQPVHGPAPRRKLLRWEWSWPGELTPAVSALLQHVEASIDALRQPDSYHSHAEPRSQSPVQQLEVPHGFSSHVPTEASHIALSTDAGQLLPTSHG